MGMVRGEEDKEIGEAVRRAPVGAEAEVVEARRQGRATNVISPDISRTIAQTALEEEEMRAEELETG
jgi:hypothetical protein